MHLEMDPVNKNIKDWNPTALATQANAVDHPTWHEALNGPNAKGDKKPCQLELHTLETKMEAWDVIPKNP